MVICQTVWNEVQMICIWSMQLMPLPPHYFLLIKIQIGLTFLVPAHQGCCGKEVIKWVSVFPIISNCLLVIFIHQMYIYVQVPSCIYNSPCRTCMSAATAYVTSYIHCAAAFQVCSASFSCLLWLAYPSQRNCSTSEVKILAFSKLTLLSKLVHGIVSWQQE